MNYGIELYFTVEISQVSNWWELAIRAMSKMPVKWVNLPMDRLFHQEGADIYVPLSRLWEELPVSSRPPFGKTLSAWNKFCGSRTDIQIVSLIVLVDEKPTQEHLNLFLRRFDHLCDQGIFTGGMWANGNGYTEPVKEWNAISWKT